MKFSVANHALVPCDDMASKFMSPLQPGEVLYVQALDQHQQKYRAFVFMALTKIATAAELDHDEFRARLLVDTGRANVVTLGNGRRVLVVKSMNVFTMADDQLKEFWAEAVPIIRKDVLPIITDTEARAEIEELLK